jgi:hypothetical protein
MYSKFLVVLLTLCLCAMAGLSAAGDLAVKAPNEGPGGAYVPSGSRADVAIWCQDPTFTGSGSSQEDDEYPFESWIADDFTVGGDEAIQSARWWGMFFNHTTVIQPDAFVISFFQYDGTCNPGVPPVLLYEYISYDYTTLDMGNGYYEYYATIPPMLVDAGTTYWFCVQAVMHFSTNGQWGWDSAASISGCDSPLLFPLLGYDVWTTTELDRAFCLYYDGEDPVATQASNWGAIKSLYR